MTLQELYALVGGNYDHALKIMRRDKLIDKYVRKFSDSQVGEGLAASVEAMDAGTIFESAHAMKGVCANLALDKLSELAGELAEEFRPGAQRSLSDEEVRAKAAALNELYQRTVDGIRQYEMG